MPRVRIASEGEGTVLDPADPAPFIKAAGDKFVAVDGNMVLVRGSDGSVQAARPGWWVIVPDDGGQVVLAGPDLVMPA